MTQVVYKTGMTELPKSCMECSIHICHLPYKAKQADYMKKEYTRKRHPKCPLYITEIKGEQG